MDTDSKPRVRVRGIPARSLTSQGYAVCLFPEQPKRETVMEQDRATEKDFMKTTVRDVETTAPTTKPAFREPEYLRLHWRNRLVYLVAFISFSLSLNNAYYFPLNVYRYGDKFFVPYTISTIVVGYPLHVLQVSMGQYSQRGIVWVWESAPLVGGIGFAMLIACVIMSMYYNIFAAYSLIYFAHCFNRALPWSRCTNISSDGEICHERIWCAVTNGTLPAKHYFYNHILNTPQKYPPEVWELGSVKWWLVLAMFFSWFVIYIATLRSARSIGKIAIFLVIYSYFAILILLILFLQLKDSDRGLELAYKGIWNVNYLNIEMWTVAAMQVALELGLCHGIPLVYGSYCHFRNFFHIDSVILCLINYINSIIFFVLFFSLLGTVMCDFDGFPWDLLHSSFGIIYIIYSDIFAPLKGSNLWCMVFFFMLFCIIIGTQIAITEAIMTVLYDNFIKLSEYRWLINFIICLCFFCIGIIFCLANGFYGANFLQTMPIWFTVMPLIFLFAFGVILFYGLDQYYKTIEIMLMQQSSSTKKLYLYFLLLILLILLIGSCFIMNASSLGGVIYYKKYVTTAWVIFGFILAPFIICAVLWVAYCFLEDKSFRSSSNSWRKYRDASKGEKGHFTKNYNPSYIWRWK